MARKAKQKEKITEILDRFLGETDPMIPIAGILGATAALGGITPPFTRLLMIFTQKGGGKGIDFDITTILGAMGGIQGMATYAPWTIGKMLFGGDGDGTPSASPEIWALAASGALEAMMMYNVMKNPEVLKAVIEAPAKMVSAVGEITPG